MAEYSPARLQTVKDLPKGDGWLYEPKFDGYRGLLRCSPSGRGSVWSRNDKDLGRWFPELVTVAGRMPRDTILDGEIVMPTETGVSFIALQRRLASLGRESPVAFIAFDLLRSDEDQRRKNLSERRRRLETLIDALGQSSLQLMAQTDDRDEAGAWLDDSLDISGIEGVVCKLDEPYPMPDARRWRKVRRVSTMEFSVRGFIPEGESVRLVLSRRDDGRALVGTTYPVGGRDIEPLERLMLESRPAEHRVWAPFDDGRHDWYRLPGSAALVAEVTVSTLDQGVLRQPARFVRWRTASPQG